MFAALKKTAASIGLDATIGITLLTRIVQAFGAIGVIIFIARYLNGNEQGYYYTFSSIIAIQVFFELGLSGIITQYTAHEYAHLTLTDDQTLIGEEYYKSRLASLLHFCVKWFGIISIALFIILIIVGFYFFNRYSTNSTVDWQKPWLILCFATAMNLFIDPLLAYFDGLGLITDMAKVRLIQKVSFIVFLIISFSLGYKLYAAPVASLFSIGINYAQIVFSHRLTLLKSIWRLKSKFVIGYMNEIFPFQWRIAVSWISGYFIFQLFNPVLFATEGPVVAGQMGMTLQALNGITALSMSWISTKVPLFSSLISQKNYSELDKFFNLTLKNVMKVTIGLVIMFIAGSQVIKLYPLTKSLSQRFIPFLPLLLMSASVIINQAIFAWATYLRCHKKEPLLMQAIVSAIYCTFSTLFFGKLFGLTGIVAGYSGWGLISVIWVYFIFLKYKKLWHEVSYIT